LERLDGDVKLAEETLKVARDVYWVGVNDTETRLFEGLWDIPEGVSYNSYLVMGSERTALIDSVKARFAEEHLNKINSLIDPSQIDFLVINHMEPDHTGGVPKVLEATPEAKVVLTPMAFNMLKAFYHVEPKVMTVRGDGATIDLGGRTLRFIQTPFLHWPETMSTYLMERKILFSCDTFGSVNRLPEGKIMDTDIGDIDQYIYSASKVYFAGIFSRYREYVLKAIKKFEDLGIKVKILAPSHGPVYTARAKEVIDLWASWSRPDYAKKAVVAVGSMYGMTLKLVKAVVEGIEGAGGKAVIHNLVEDTPASVLGAVIDAPALLIGTPTYEYGLFPPVGYFLNLLETKKLTDRFVGVFGNFAWAGGGVKRLVEQLNTLGFKMVGSPVRVKGSPLPEDLKRAKEMAKAVAETAFKELGL
jgi:flavorubredoxin